MILGPGRSEEAEERKKEEKEENVRAMVTRQVKDRASWHTLVGIDILIDIGIIYWHWHWRWRWLGHLDCCCC